MAQFQVKIADGWKDFSNEDDRLLKQEFLAGSKIAFLTLRGHCYEFNFKNMTQKNLSTGRIREIRAPRAQESRLDKMVPHRQKTGELAPTAPKMADKIASTTVPTPAVKASKLGAWPSSDPAGRIDISTDPIVLPASAVSVVSVSALRTEDSGSGRVKPPPARPRVSSGTRGCSMTPVDVLPSPGCPPKSDLPAREFMTMQALHGVSVAPQLLVKPTPHAEPASHHVIATGLEPSAPPPGSFEAAKKDQILDLY